MKDYTPSIARLVSVFLLTFTLICSFAYLAPGSMLRPVAAQSMSPSGSFGYLIHASYTDPTNKFGFALIGLMNFDGAGNVTGTYTSEPENMPQTRTGTLTGTYTTNPDGSGSMTISDDTGTNFTFATVMVDGGQGMQLLATNCSGGKTVTEAGGCTVGGTTQISGVARAAYAGPLQAGSYGIQFTILPQGALNIGVVSLDGAGNLTVSSTGVFLSGTPGQPTLFSVNDTGTYSLNPDGTGSFVFAAMPGQNAQMYAMVVTDGGSGLLAVQVKRSGDGVSFGTGRLQ